LESIRTPIFGFAKLEAGQTVSHSLAAGRHAWIHVAEGE
jgi:hypothetical protein